VIEKSKKESRQQLSKPSLAYWRFDNKADAMPVFAYTALDLTHRSRSGTLLAETAVEGRESLRTRGLRVLTFAPARVRSKRLLRTTSARRHEQVAEVARYLSLLLKASVPVAEALDVVTRKRSGHLPTVLKEVRDKITAGEALADALAAFPDWFDQVFVSAVRVGEISGQLDEALRELADYLRTQTQLRSQITAALTYPMILSAVCVMVVVFLMSYVVPQLLGVLATTGRPLPASTMLLKSVSDLLTQHGLALFIGVVVIATVLALFLRTPTGRRWRDEVVLQTPLVSTLIRKSLVASFAQRMSLLLLTGVPFVDGLRHVIRMTSNTILAKELAAMAHAVESGSDIAPTMEASRVFPPVVSHLVAVGQDSGELTGMLTELKQRYETEVRLAITRTTTILEPLLIIVLAAVVGFVVLACLMPMMEITRALE
jgi:type II secretory pathway component PulF